MALVETAGHPLNRLTEENKALDELIEAIRPKVADKTATFDDVNTVRQLSVHYAKKRRLIISKIESRLSQSVVHPWLCGLLMAIFATN